MSVTLPCWLQSGSYSAELDRQAISALGAGASGKINARSGVLRSANSEMAVAQTGTASMAVTVAPGKALVSGTFTTTQGTYVVVNSSSVTLTVAAASSTLARIDLVAIQIQDSVYSGSQNQALLSIITGTPASTPTVPVLPPSSLALAQVRVGANASSVVTANITDSRLFTAAAGGIVPVQTGDTGSGGHDGQYRDEPAQFLQRWNAATSSWVTYGRPVYVQTADPGSVPDGSVWFKPS